MKGSIVNTRGSYKSVDSNCNEIYGIFFGPTKDIRSAPDFVGGSGGPPSKDNMSFEHVKY